MSVEPLQPSPDVGTRSNAVVAPPIAVASVDSLSRALDTAAPVILAASKFVAASEPLAHATVDLAKTFWARLEPYHPHEFGPAIIGAR